MLSPDKNAEQMLGATEMSSCEKLLQEFPKHSLSKAGSKESHIKRKMLLVPGRAGIRYKERQTT